MPLQAYGGNSVYLHHVLWEWNSVAQVWQQALLSSEPCCRHMLSNIKETFIIQWGS